MEVHQHTHTPRKKWIHYFWEFLMLFLAVFCGFFAEYQLEHKIEKEKELQFIKSLSDDLRGDIKILEQSIAGQKTGIILLDSLLTIISDKQLIKTNGDQLYYTARIGPRLNTLSNNNKTFEQLKNSGGFRLIRNTETANKIMAYYNGFHLIRLLEEIFLQEFGEYKKLAAKIFDPLVLRIMEREDGQISRHANNPALRTYDPELLKELGVYIVYLNGTRRGILPEEENLKQAGNDLIIYLEKEYHLK